MDDWLVQPELLQTLWGGYGQILRVKYRGGTAILKRVDPPASAAESTSDRRKRRSYEVEQNWYRDCSALCDQDCRAAECYGTSGPLLLLEDLNAAGFHPLRSRPIGAERIRAGLRWLAHFHRRFLGRKPAGLWEQGTYWHLDTRREEWERMPAGRLKDGASEFDGRLKGARFQTVVHGDAKPANFLWNERGVAAAVDFQYVGPGCGIRDVAYFLDCCDCGPEWLDVYFGFAAFPREVEQEWRSLYPVACDDFARFMQGWGR